jgi:hypothetical protein
LLAASSSHFHDYREAVLVWIQRRQIGGELFRQHRKNPGRRVHRGRVVTGVRVDGRAVFHERVHIGDGHSNRDGIGGQGVGDRELVQIAGVVVVDGRPQQTREITNRRGLCA